jgi:hypothetical protein
MINQYRREIKRYEPTRPRQAKNPAPQLRKPPHERTQERQMAAQLLFFLGFAAVVAGGHVHAHRDAAIAKQSL